MLFVVLILFVLICFIGLTINVGHRVSKKIELQNAADAAAMSGAIWIARGLNLISILNVSMTEILAFIIFFEAIKKGNELILPIWTVNVAVATALTAFPFTASYGGAWLGRLTTISSSGFSEYTQLSQRIGSHNQSGTILGNLWDLLDSIASAQRAIQNLPPAAALANAFDIGQKNGADTTLLLPVSFGLPVIEGEFSDLCQPTREDGGGPGYRNFLCWEGGALSMPPEAVGLPSAPPLITRLKHLFATLWLVYPYPTLAPDAPGFTPLFSPGVVPPIGTLYSLLVDAAYDSLCGSGSGGITFESQTTACEACTDNDGADVLWRGYDCQVATQDVNAQCIDEEDAEDLGERGFADFDDSRNFFEDQRLTQRSKPIEPLNPAAGTTCTFSALRSETETVTNPDTGSTTTVVKYFKTEWAMTGCTIEESESVAVGTPPDPPTPLMIDPDWVSRSEYLALSTMGVGDKLTFTGLTYEAPGETVTFGDAGDRETVSVAQVKVYNATGPDLFNQDWRVRLVPVNLAGLNTDVTQFLTQFPIFQDALGAFLAH
jgi:hypothetical protein